MYVSGLKKYVGYLDFQGKSLSSRFLYAILKAEPEFEWEWG